MHAFQSNQLKNWLGYVVQILTASWPAYATVIYTVDYLPLSQGY